VKKFLAYVLIVVAAIWVGTHPVQAAETLSGAGRTVWVFISHLG
jgi:hypothetical protein